MRSSLLVITVAAALAGSASAQGDKLIIPDGSAPPGDSLLLPLSIAGSSPVVAMQFDVRFNKAVVDILSPVAAGGSNHRIMSREIATGLRRVLVFSRSNALLPKDVIIDLPMIMDPAAEGRPAPVLKIERMSFALEDGTRITPSVQRGPLAAWFAANFTPAELQIPSIYGDDSDPDGDGLVNLVEYGVGGSPLFFDAPLLPLVTTETGPDGEFWQMIFRQSKSASGVMIEPQISADLVDWTDLPVIPTGVEDALSIELSASVDKDAPRTFMRLNVRRSDP